MLFILLGCLTGAAVAYLLPSPYRAEATLHVAYNADVHLRNPDDYKNWQMEQLNIFILADEVLGETLQRLQSQNSTWSETTVDDLNASLHVYWRNAGEWSLVAKAPRPELAVELLDTWQQVILEQIDSATDHAHAVLDLSTRVDTLYLERVDTNLRISELNQTKDAIQAWLQNFDDNLAGSPLEARERWQLISRAASATGWNPAGAALLAETPPPEAAASAYLPWLEKMLVFIDHELETLEPQSRQLTEEYEQLYSEWEKEQESSRGLTAYLEVSPLDDGSQPAEPVRPTATMVFVGGMLGLLTWALTWLMKPVRRARSQIT